MGGSNRLLAERMSSLTCTCTPVGSVLKCVFYGSEYIVKLKKIYGHYVENAFTNQWKSENLSMLKINDMKDDISVQAWT